ncbi:MAG: hypothetical protein ABH826_00165 [Patescibacteria group bacterium]
MNKAIETSLLEIDISSQKCHLKMMDGSKWFVNPYDLPTIATWIPTETIEIKKNINAMFSYDITNIAEGVTVTAIKL